jgi:integrase
MKTKKELFPVLSNREKNFYQVTIWYRNKRFRYSNGNVIGVDIRPNTEEIDIREARAQLLRSAFEIEIAKGWRPKFKSTPKATRPTITEVVERALKRKLSTNYSEVYKTDLKRTHQRWLKYCKERQIEKMIIDDLTVDIVRDFIFSSSPSPKSMANLKRNISSILKDEAESYGVLLNLKRIKIPKTTQTLHKPIRDVGGLLNAIKDHNDNLYICALLTYGLLLRPHREIRCLKRGDFNEDFTILSLDGKRVKSKKNRIIPIPSFIQIELKTRLSHLSNEANIFSKRENPYHKDYFKGLWRKFKLKTDLLNPNETLYSLRHAASLSVFKKTGSLQKLQQVLGHSSMLVSLTYLRGLEVPQIDVKDLPEL